MNTRLNLIGRLFSRNRTNHVKVAGLVVLLTTCTMLSYSSSGFAETGSNATPPTNPSINPSPARSGSAPAARTPKSSSKSASAPNMAKPLWSDLTPTQQEALAPLAAEWNKIEAPRKKKWLALSNKYQSMKPDEKARLHERMRDWAKLTPEQRRVARESFARANKLNQGQRNAEWQQYQKLPEEQKKKLAEEAAAKKRITTLPSATQNKNKIPSPPKSTLKHNGANAALPAASKSAVEPAHSNLPSKQTP